MSVERLVQQGHRSGKLNLSGLSLKQLPKSVWEPVAEASVDFSKQHAGWWDIVDLTRIIACDNELETLDERIGELGALVFMDLRNNFLSSLPTQMDQLQKLVILNLSGNKFDAFPAVLCDLPLVELYLNNNQVESVPDSIGRLSMLNILDLQDNKIKQLPTALSKVSKLAKLNLSKNQLLNVDLSVLSGSQLSHLDLSFNQMDKIVGTCAFPKLSILDIKQNNLTAIDARVSCPVLKDLFLCFNRIGFVDPGFLESMIGLENLDLRDNRLVKLPQEILSLRKLKRLDISNNNISMLPPKLGLLDNLGTFLYSGNPLRGLPSSNSTQKLMQHLRNKIPLDEMPQEKTPELKTLQLEDDQFADVDPTVQELDISRKNLTFVSPVNRFVRLRSLVLSYNRLSSLDTLSFDYLTYLDLSNNLLTHLDFLGSLPVLDHLAVNNNKMQKLEFKHALPNLSSLFCASNKIPHLDARMLLEKTPHLRVLDVSNNEIAHLMPELALLDLTNLQVAGNTFRVPRPMTVQRGTAAIMEYLKSRIAH
ncbi:hypothetical protein EDD86DRAFT_204965 [Gorgonomyces haynaldii]|nr:hypothetical protein EDD86DRAFT_204965 [Gorgonomyces haynaldii]